MEDPGKQAVRELLVNAPLAVLPLIGPFAFGGSLITAGSLIHYWVAGSSLPVDQVCRFEQTSSTTFEVGTKAIPWNIYSLLIEKVIGASTTIELQDGAYKMLDTGARYADLNFAGEKACEMMIDSTMMMVVPFAIFWSFVAVLNTLGLVGLIVGNEDNN